MNSHSHQELIVYTDSLFALKLIQLGSSNVEDIQKIKYREIVSMIVNFVNIRYKPVYFMKVSAHQGYIGNENADIMAKMSVYKNDAINIDDLKTLQSPILWSKNWVSVKKYHVGNKLMMIKKWWL